MRNFLLFAVLAVCFGSMTTANAKATGGTNRSSIAYFCITAEEMEVGCNDWEAAKLCTAEYSVNAVLLVAALERVEDLTWLCVPYSEHAQLNMSCQRRLFLGFFGPRWVSDCDGSERTLLETPGTGHNPCYATDRPECGFDRFRGGGHSISF